MPAASREGRRDVAWIASAGFESYLNRVGLLSLVFDAYSLVVFLYVILSWFRLPEDHPLVRITSRLTEPALAPIRRLLPVGGGLDISPMVLLLALRLIKRLLLS